jgi:phosphopantetheine adenylyltransferase
VDDQVYPGTITWRTVGLIGAVVAAIASALSVYFIETRDIRLDLAKLRNESNLHAEEMLNKIERQRDVELRLIFERIQKNQSDISSAIAVGNVRWENQQDINKLVKESIFTLEQSTFEAAGHNE